MTATLAEIGMAPPWQYLIFDDFSHNKAGEIKACGLEGR